MLSCRFTRHRRLLSLFNFPTFMYLRYFQLKYRLISRRTTFNKKQQIEDKIKQIELAFFFFMHYNEIN